MDNEYYILEGGARIGPFTADELMDRPLEPSDMVLLPMQTQAVAAHELEEFTDYFKSEGIYYPTVDNTAGFLPRFAAYFIDCILMVIVISFALPIFFPEYVLEMQKAADYKSMSANMNVLPLQLAVILFRTAYFSICESSKWQGTIGKRIVGLAVVDELGYTVTFWQALKRNLTRIASEFFFCIGYVSIFFLPKHQAMHDQFAKAFVVQKSRV